MSGPDITIALPTVNRLGFVGTSLRSAAAQTHGSVEILLSDNSADPRYAEQLDGIVETTRAGFPEAAIRLLRQPERVPMNQHSNLLIHEAKGRFWAYLSDDDILLPQWGERFIDGFARYPSAAFGFSNHWIIDENGVRNPELSDAHTKGTDRSGIPEGLVGGRDLDRAALRSSVPLPGTMYRIQTLREFGFTPHSEAPDTDLVLRIADRGEIAGYFLPERLAEYRRHPGNLSGRWTVRQRRSIVETLEGCHSLALRDARSYRHALSQAHATLGKTYLTEGDRGQAARSLWRALALDPTNALAYRFLLQIPLRERSRRSSVAGGAEHP